MPPALGQGRLHGHGGSIDGRVAQKIGHSALSAGHPDDLTGRIMGRGKDKEREASSTPYRHLFPPHRIALHLLHLYPPSNPSSTLHDYTLLHHTQITMSFNKFNRATASSVNGPSHGRINGSHLSQDQNEPRTNGCVYLVDQSKAQNKPTNADIGLSGQYFYWFEVWWISSQPRLSSRWTVSTPPWLSRSCA